jgi:hypothetical protein
MAIKIRKYCPHCGSQNIHKMEARPFDKRRVVYFCGSLEHNGIPAGCGWVWCIPKDMWLMAKSLKELEETGGIMFMAAGYTWLPIHRCSCGNIFRNSEGKWIQEPQLPKGVLTLVCPKCGKIGLHLEGYYMGDMP